MGQLLGQRLVLAGAADGQILPLGAEGRRFVAVGRDAQFVGDAPGQLPRQGGTLLERDARNGDQRQDIRRAHAGVSPLVVAHVDPFGGPFHTGEGRFDHRLGTPDEGHHRTVGRLARVDVEHLDLGGRFDGLHDLPNHLFVASLAEVGNALHDTFLHKFVHLGFLCFKYTNFSGFFR